MPQEKRYLVIWNTNAGSAAGTEDLRKELQSRPDVTLCQTSTGKEARQLAAEADQAGVRRVVVAGGDGTVNTVINALYESGSRATLGILPLGTGNDLCRTLEIPLDPLEAFALVTNESHEPSWIDLVRVETNENGLVFANVCNGGNSQRVRDCLTDEMKRTWGPWAYLRGAIEVLTELTEFKVSVKLDEQPAQSLDVWNVVVANGRTVAGGVAVAPRAEIADGLLDVILIHGGTTFDLAALSAKLFLSDYLEDDRVTFRRARRVEFHSDPPLQFVADGEMVVTTPVVFTVKPHALRVIAGTTGSLTADKR